MNWMCSLVSVVSYLVDSFGTIADWNMLWSKAVGKSKTATHRKELTRMLFLLLFASFFHSFIVYHISVFCLCAFYFLSLSHTLSPCYNFSLLNLCYIDDYIHMFMFGRSDVTFLENYTLADGARETHIEHGMDLEQLHGFGSVYILCLLLYSVCA